MIFYNPVTRSTKIQKNIQIYSTIKALPKVNSINKVIAIILPTDVVALYKLVSKIRTIIIVKSVIEPVPLLKRYLKRGILWAFDLDYMCEAIINNEYQSCELLKKFYYKLMQLKELVYVCSNNTKNERVIEKLHAYLYTN